MTADLPAEPEPGPAILELTDVSVELGGLPVLRGVTMAVSAGETVALLGGNGSGKSTLVRAVVGLLPHQRGLITLFGRPLRLFRDWQRIGYVPQRTPVGTSAATVREVVAAGRLARRIPFLPAGRQQRQAVAEALATVGMAERAADPISWLSGGQQQRVLIARALVAKPRLLILDEPNAGVDLEHQRILASVLDRLTADGTAVLVVLHEVGPLAGQIDRAVVLSEGRVAYHGSLAAIPGLRTGGHECDEPVAGPGLIGSSLIDPPVVEARGDLARRDDLVRRNGAS